MKFLIILICSFLTITVPTLEQTTFEEIVHKNYEQYYYLVSEEVVIGDVIIVMGTIKKDIYISGYIYNTTSEKHLFKLSNGNTYSECFYKVKLTEDLKIMIQTSKGTNFKTYEVENISYNDLMSMNMEKGEGKNSFPSERIKLDIFDIYALLSFVFIGIIALFTIILVMLYRKKEAKFKQNYHQDREFNFEKNDIIEISNNYFEEEKAKTKDEQMEEAYEEFKKGKITEEELNNRLRRIWWSEEDD